MVRLVSARPKIREDTRLLLIGDSMAEGLSPHLNALATEQGVPYIGAGVSGATIPDWTAAHWLESTLDDFQPTLVLIALGTNDAYSNYTPEQTADHARMLLGKIPFETDVVWIGPPLLPQTYAGRHPDTLVIGAMKNEAPEWFASAEWVIPRGPDELHPTAYGYAGWAGAIWERLT